MKKLFLLILLTNYITFAQYTTIDLGNTNNNTTLFQHSGNNTPVPFNLRKTGYSGNSISYGLLTLDMQHNTIGGGSNLHFRLRNSINNYKEYGGLGSYIIDNTSGSEDGALTFYTTYNGSHRTRRMTILNDGNVGIGTTSPNEKLQIGNAFTFHDGGHEVIGFNYAASVGMHLDNTKYASEIRFDPVNGYLGLGVSSSITNTPSSKLFINKNGNVGIGVSSPINKFHVVHSSGEGFAPALSGNIATFQTNANSGYYASINVIGGSSGKTSLFFGDKDDGAIGGLRYNNANNSLGIRTNGVDDRLLINSSGNIGIGTATPDSKLTVAGKIHAREVKVTIDAGADFVFEKNYHLPPLNQLETFIKANKHLPEIASEKEMQENGLHLAKMNIKLLQKIEELTLYTINQEKRLNTLEKENSTLKSQNKKIEHLEKQMTLLLKNK